ncbi:TonB-dependent receptor [Exilibacterium tricleocarpae]|uniref:TonB-dependent receptor n=1 Tax=Exilibacterium tricleocarpae TaxID=2591008 RepID=A0A545T5Y1_9GAMM|nr:TonB-dependent receptor [Exilibacterium tricleocarpae]TQV72623.1 TonB-dependent receptor [Exilibacterium tricleocarpae]
MSDTFQKTVLISSMTLAMAAAHSVVMAQTGEGLRSELEEITVTSQRREASLQEVPVAVTALGPEDMELKQVANVRDLQYQVPNISIATNTGTASGARVFLRGVGEDESRVSADPAVGIYVDGVYVGRQVGALFDLVDLERIEVLRGPQGTLYGRNSNGGAIKLVSKAPQMAENTLELKATVGSDDRIDGRLTGNLALSDSTAVRATLLSKSRDGFHTLNPNGALADRAGTNVGEVDMQAFRVALLHDFDSGWSANLALDYTGDDSDPVPDSIARSADADNDLFTIEPLPGEDNVCAADSTTLGCFTGYSSEVETRGVTLNIAGEIGEYSLSLLTGYRQMEDDLASRIGALYLQETDQDQLSQEITLTSNASGPFNFVAGLYYFTEDVQLDSVFFLPFALGVETDAFAVFYKGTYAISDTLTAGAGVRYTDESKDLDAANLGIPGFTRNESVDFTNTTFTLTLDQQFSEQVMGYLSYSTGFKSGGWSPDCFSATACFLPVDEEELDSFEVGIRSDLFDNRLRLNATYFFNQYDNLQIAGTVPGLGFTRFNVDETEISGLELELVFKATQNLTLNATLGTLDAEYTKLTAGQASGLTNAGTSPGCRNVPAVGEPGRDAGLIACARDLDLKNAPELKGTVGLVYTAAVAGGVLTAGLDLAFEDESFNLVANAPPHAEVDVDTLVDARIAYEPASGAWQLAIWGKNLTDEEYARAATAPSFSQYAADPLTWGVDFGYRF